MRRAFVLLIVAILARPAQSQDTGEDACRDATYRIQQLLDDRGHHERSVARNPDGALLVRYDDRTSRQPLRERQHIERQIAELLPGCSSVQTRAYRYGLPVAGERTGDMSSGDWRALRGPRLDLELEPLFGYQVDFFETPYRVHIALGPLLRVWWPNGLTATAQVSVPVYNKIGRWGSAYHGTTFVNRASVGVRRTVGSSVLASVSGGLFERNRYGGDVQAYWLSADRPLAIGVRASVTGYYSIQDGSWNSTSPSTVTGYVDGTAWLPWYELRVRGRAGWLLEQYTDRWRPGEYLYGAAGVKGELTRMFGETEVTFSGTVVNQTLYPGIRIGVPLAPRRGLARGRAAAYVSPRFEGFWDYGRVVRGKSTGYVNPLRGETFDSGLDIWPLLRHTAPAMEPVLDR